MALQLRPRRQLTGDWRDYRPAIWLVYIGIAVAVLLSLPVSLLFFGGALGIAVRVWQAQNRRR